MIVQNKNMTLQDRLNGVYASANFTKVKLVAVTKYVDSDKIIEAYHAGLREFGENKVQDALEKISKLSHLPGVQWHFIGHLQRNKVKDVVGHFALIHSVDSLRLAEEISKRATDLGITQKILLQVNVSGEVTKSGFSEELLFTEFPKITSLANINIVGLMTMAPNTEDKTIVERCFKKLCRLRDNLEAQGNISLLELSMGMSQDYHIAIECGATIVRLGSVIFK